MITYEKVIKYFKNAPNITDYPPQNDDCCRLANTFFSGFGEQDDCIFAAAIKDRMLAGSLTELHSFSVFSEQEAYDLVLSGFIPKASGDQKIINPSQKWHLYVSYFAYQEVRALLDFPSKVIKVNGCDFANTPFSFKQKVKQKEYKRWIILSAGLDENASLDQVEAVIESE